MSNLSEFIGGGIKSVQSGTTALTGFTTLVNEPITAVDTAKSFISINGIDTSSTLVLPCGSAELLNSTTVRVIGRRPSGTSVTITITWTVVEYY